MVFVIVEGLLVAAIVYSIHVIRRLDKRANQIGEMINKLEEEYDNSIS